MLIIFINFNPNRTPVLVARIGCTDQILLSLNNKNDDFQSITNILPNDSVSDIKELKTQLNIL